MQGNYVITVSDPTPALRVDVLVYAAKSSDISVISRLVSDQFLAYNASKQSDLISIGTVFTGPSSFLPPPDLSMKPWIYASSGSAAWAFVVIGFSIRGRVLKNGITLAWVRMGESK